jgi:hypothetical protein
MLRTIKEKIAWLNEFSSLNDDVAIPFSGKCFPLDEREKIRGHLRRFMIMRSILITLLMGEIMLLVSSCATVPTKPLAPGELRLLSMDISQRSEIKMDVPFEVKINFEADGEPEIRTACFYWAGDGPYCFKVMDVNYGSPGTIKVKLLITRSGYFGLESYVVYTREGKGQPTNVVSFNIRVLR